jgi:hypothetical protein
MHFDYRVVRGVAAPRTESQGGEKTHAPDENEDESSFIEEPIVVDEIIRIEAVVEREVIQRQVVERQIVERQEHVAQLVEQRLQARRHRNSCALDGEAPRAVDCQEEREHHR